MPKAELFLVPKPAAILRAWPSPRLECSSFLEPAWKKTVDYGTKYSSVHLYNNTKCGHWGMVFDAGNCQTSLDIITISALIISGMATVTLTVDILRGSAFTSSLSDCATAA